MKAALPGTSPRAVRTERVRRTAVRSAACSGSVKQRMRRAPRECGPRAPSQPVHGNSGLFSVFTWWGVSRRGAGEKHAQYAF